MPKTPADISLAAGRNAAALAQLRGTLEHIEATARPYASNDGPSGDLAAAILRIVERAMGDVEDVPRCVCGPYLLSTGRHSMACEMAVLGGELADVEAPR